LDNIVVITPIYVFPFDIAITKEIPKYVPKNIECVEIVRDSHLGSQKSYSCNSDLYKDRVYITNRAIN